jgi:hypothetical protein
VNRRAIIGLLVAGGAAATYGIFFMSSDEDEIRARCDELEVALTFPADRGNPAFFAIALKDKLRDVLAPGAQVIVPEAGEGALGLDALVGGAIQIAGQYRTAGVDLEDVRISILGDDTATVTCRGVATAFDHAGAPHRHERSVTMEVQKVDGEWRFSRITAVRPGE